MVHNEGTSMALPGLPSTFNGTIPEWNSSTTDAGIVASTKDYKELAIIYTVEYFKNKQVSQEIFMRHLETVYNFLLDGKVSYK